MCGLAGFIDRGRGRDKAALLGIAEAMTDRLVHRGPDDGGVWADGEAGIGLGFRRLAIQDLSPDGAQPMQAAAGRFTLVFNGEIYNFLELRRILDAEGGWDWQGRSDTEVLLAACCLWGVETALSRLDGMFAFALWDARRRVLTLARDRMGCLLYTSPSPRDA